MKTNRRWKDKTQNYKPGWRKHISDNSYMNCKIIKLNEMKWKCKSLTSDVSLIIYTDYTWFLLQYKFLEQNNAESKVFLKNERK